jgi:hypothetical protein
MSLGHFEILGMVADGFQMLLIALILFLLVRYRKRSSPSDKSEWAPAGAGPFRHEFLIQSLLHQTDLAFDHIEKTIQTERRHLKEITASGHQQEALNDSCLPDAPSEAAPFDIDAAPLSDEPDDGDNPYQKVHQLAADGMNPQRIAKQLSIPRGEVELVLKMAASASPARSGSRPTLPPQPRRLSR